MKPTIVLICVIALLGLTSHAPAGIEMPGGARAVSDGSGNVKLFWFPPGGTWPRGGFQVQDQQGKILVHKIQPRDDAQWLRPLSGPAQQWIRRVVQDPAQLWRRDAAAGLARKALALKAAISFDFAAALGVAHTLNEVPSGKRRFQVVGLDANGRPTRMVMQTNVVDAATASPRPPAPVNLRAIATPAGVALYWRVTTGNTNTTACFKVERRGRDDEFTDILEEPLLPARQGTENSTNPQPAFIDTGPPQRKSVTYRVHGVDLFGRAGSAAQVELFVPDLACLLPPATVTAVAQDGGIRVQWSAGKVPADTRFVIERSPSPAGPFQVLTPKGVPAGPQGYMDRPGQAGFSWFYRIRTAAANGELSPPSATARVRTPAGGPPPAVRSLKARLGIGTVVLEWSPAENASIAGYLVENNVAGTWQRINDTLRREPRFTYSHAAGDTAEMVFRVRAVDRDNRLGEPSPAVRVRIRRMPRGTPEIIALRPEDRGVEIVFDFPSQRQDLQFVVRRSGTETEEGLIVSPRLSARTRSFVDTRLAPGETYWYRIQALGPQNWRSDYSRAVAVHVAAAAIPAPPAPMAAFKDSPFDHVRVEFAAPPLGLQVVVERRNGEKDLWQTLDGEGGDSIYLDANPPKATQLQYRIRFKALDNTLGPPSPAVAVTSKK